MTKYRVHSASIYRGHCLLGVEILDHDGKDGLFLAKEDDRQKLLKITVSRIVFSETNEVTNRRILVAEPPTFDVVELVGKVLVESDG